MNNFKKELSIIIVNYNGEYYLENCLDSIYKYCSSIRFEIIVVDNNSSDKSVSTIKEKYPEVNLIESKENLGFARGNNLAAKEAKGDCFLLLNNDTILLDHLKPVLNLITTDNTIGVVGIKMLDRNEIYKKSVGNFPKIISLLFFSKLFKNKKGFEKGNFTENKLEVDWIEGSFLFLKKELYTKINGFAEDYFMYVEDVDLCKKIALQGKKRVFLPNLSYIHYGGFNKSKQHLLIEGYLIYVAKYFGRLKFVGIIILKIKKIIFKFIK